VTILFWPRLGVKSAVSLLDVGPVVVFELCEIRERLSEEF